MRVSGSTLWPFARKKGKDKQADDLASLRARLEDAASFHQQYYDGFDKWQRYYDGSEQYDELYTGLITHDLADLVGDITYINMLYATVEHYLSTIMQTVPMPFVTGNDASQDEDSQLITHYLHAYARAQNVAGQQEMAYRSALINGTGVLKSYWDTRRKRVVIRNIPPKMLVVDPAAARLEDASFLALRNEYSEDMMRALWPTVDMDSIEEVDPTQAVGPDTSAACEVRKVLVWECYREFGRRLTIFTAEQVLYDGDSPVPGGEYPVTVMRMGDREDRFFGIGLVEILQPLQTNVNRILTRLQIHAHFTSNPIVVTSSGAPIRMVPGFKVQHETPDMRTEFLRPERIPAQTFDLLNLLMQGHDTMSGVHEVLRGLKPKGVNAGVALDILQQAALIRLQGQIRNWAARMAEVWQLTLGLTQQYEAGGVRSPRLVEGRAGMVTVPRELLSVGVQKFDDNGLPEFDAETGEPAVEALPLPYHIVMQEDTELPLSAAHFAQLAVQLVQLGIGDAQFVLDALRVPGRVELLERMAGVKGAEVAGMQAAMQGGGLPNSPGNPFQGTPGVQLPQDLYAAGGQ